MTPPTDAQLVPIRETIRAAIDEWRSTCRIERNKTHIDLEALLVGAMLAMAQAGTITNNPLQAKNSTTSKEER